MPLHAARVIGVTLGTWLLILSAVFALLLGWGGWVRRRRSLGPPRMPGRPAVSCPPQAYPLEGAAAATGPVLRETFRRSGPSPASSWRYADQPALWREALAEVGKRLEAWGVIRLVLVHGTFVGDDPFSILTVVRSLVPGLPPEMDRALSGLARSASRQVLRDHGNFLPEYAELLGNGLGSAVRVDRFTWSASNHHVARLDAAVELADSLQASLAGRRRPSRAGVRVAADPAPGPRFLLMGHSHAGQVFALLMQMLASVDHVAELFAVLDERGVDVPRFRAQLDRLRGAAFDVVTLGTPPRYGWPSWTGYRLLHMINHRGSTTQAGSLRGLLHTTDGDYIQQWGIAGSDLPATDVKTRELNRRLDAVLGVGADTKAWRAYVRAGVRVPASGTTLLVDYCDGGRIRPNAIESFFGHAVYTRRRVMLFNLERVVDHLYPAIVDSVGRRAVTAFGWRPAWLRLVGRRSAKRGRCPGPTPGRPAPKISGRAASRWA